MLVRVALAATALPPLGVRALRGRWAAVRASWRVVVLYGVLAVLGAQLSFFFAVSRMDVGPALLIEYTAPAAVVLWLWRRHGERPAGSRSPAPRSPPRVSCSSSTCCPAPPSTGSACSGRWARWWVRRRTS